MDRDEELVARLNQRAVALAQTGRYEEAQSALRLALALDSSNAQARQNLLAVTTALRIPRTTSGALVSVIVPLHNRVDVAQRCLEALSENTPGDLFELIVVDRGSSDATPRLLGMLEGDVKRVTFDRDAGFTRAINAGAQHASGRYLMLLRQDCQPHSGWLQPLLARAESDPLIGAVGARLVDAHGRTIDSGGWVLRNGETRRNLSPDPAEVGYCSSAALLVRRSAWVAAGGFDEQFEPRHFEDVDLCLLMRHAGYAIWCEPGSVVTFEDGDTTGSDLRGRNQLRLVTKWARILSNDA